jgi:ubiquinone/menaquinone biosynthesis C-methylase UbiE
LKAAIRAQFNRQAACYLRGSGMDDPETLGRMVAAVCPGPADRALDVACGAGFLALALARRAERVAGVDLSERMLAEAEHLRAAQGAENVAFLRGDAERLPFGDGRFQAVTCKLAFHYFPGAARALSEMRRVLAPRGRLALMDRVASEDPARRAWHIRIERARTPSKLRLYAPSEVVALLRGAGFEVVDQRAWARRLDFEDWVRRTGASEEMARCARDLMTASICGDRAGLDPRWEGEKLTFSMPEFLVVALREDHEDIEGL